MASKVAVAVCCVVLAIHAGQAWGSEQPGGADGVAECEYCCNNIFGSGAGCNDGCITRVGLGDECKAKAGGDGSFQLTDCYGRCTFLCKSA